MKLENGWGSERGGCRETAGNSEVDVAGGARMRGFSSIFLLMVDKSVQKSLRNGQIFITHTFPLGVQGANS